MSEHDEPQFEEAFARLADEEAQLDEKLRLITAHRRALTDLAVDRGLDYSDATLVTLASHLASADVGLRESRGYSLDHDRDIVMELTAGGADAALIGLIVSYRGVSPLTQAELSVVARKRTEAEAQQQRLQDIIADIWRIVDELGINDDDLHVDARNFLQVVAGHCYVLRYKTSAGDIDKQRASLIEDLSALAKRTSLGDLASQIVQRLLSQ